MTAAERGRRGALPIEWTRSLPSNMGASRDHPRSVLQGRRSECEALAGLLDQVQAGRSSVLVLRGEAGCGKSALLDFVVERASGFRVARVVGVESEMELAFAGLHQLCSPMLDRVGELPVPQQDALRVAFGLQRGMLRIASSSDLPS